MYFYSQSSELYARDHLVTPDTVHSDWYYPDGSMVQFDAGGQTFRANRGLNEVISDLWLSSSLS